MNKNVAVIIFLVLTFFIIKITKGQEYIEFERYVSGEYFDTFSLCPDSDGDILIDLQDVNGDGTDLFYIPQEPGDWSKPVGSQKLNSGNWANFYKNVTIYPTTPIFCRNFTINCRDNWQNFGFILNLEDTEVQCDTFVITNPNYRDYVSMGCNAVLVSKYIEMNYIGQPPAVNGTIVSEKFIITDGNNTSTTFGECCLLKTDTLVVNQSGQNSIKIDGHIIAEVVQSQADLVLEYNESTITVGELPSNVKIIGGDNTTVNLCVNPSTGADNLGYFTGTIMYAKENWQDTDPQSEGDVNFCDYSSGYWIWKNKNRTPEIIAAYSTQDACFSEFIDLYLFINEEKSTYLRTDALPEKNNAIFYDYTGRKIGNPDEIRQKSLIFSKSLILWDGR